MLKVISKTLVAIFSFFILIGTTHAGCPLQVEVTLDANSSHSSIKVEEVYFKKLMGTWARLKKCEGLSVSRGQTNTQTFVYERK